MCVMEIGNRKRRFYVKISGAYLYKITGGYEWMNGLVWPEEQPPKYAHKFTDEEYDMAKPELPSNHTLELVK